MNDGDNKTLRDLSEQRILLIGDIDRVLLDEAELPEEMVEVCPDMLAGIDIAASEDFIAIGVVMANAGARLSCSLEALRDNCDGKIVLLAQMHEEPAAIALLKSTLDGAGVADDYVICPAHVSDVLRCLSRPSGIPCGRKTSFRAASGSPVDWPASRRGSVEKRMQLLERLATEDDLTGLKNRRYIWEFARQIIERARSVKERVTLLVFDIDDLKKYNDSYGHAVGDEVLRQAAALMKRCCRRHDIVGRIGGDEFAVVFWQDPRRRKETGRKERRSASAEHPLEVISVAKRLVSELENVDISEFGGLGAAGKGVLTISGGLASFPRDGDSIEQLFEKADQALLEAKRSGKNRIYLVGAPNGDISKME